jgi:hypothetical protein
MTMSVAVLVKFKDESKDRAYLPVATEGAFTHWARAARELGLSIVASFDGNGADVRPEELPGLIAELRAIRSAFASSPETSGFVERADFLIASLEALDPQFIAEIWGG